jgi:hypothetical protein
MRIFLGRWTFGAAPLSLLCSVYFLLLYSLLLER